MHRIDRIGRKVSSRAAFANAMGCWVPAFARTTLLPAGNLVSPCACRAPPAADKSEGDDGQRHVGNDAHGDETGSDDYECDRECGERSALVRRRSWDRIGAIGGPASASRGCGGRRVSRAEGRPWGLSTRIWLRHLRNPGCDDPGQLRRRRGWPGRR